MPGSTSLPLLTDDELANLFGDDMDAQRRYRMLNAVMLGGMTQRDAATAADVSERTIRNVLRAYTRGGLAALRSRQTVARRRRDRRSNLFEQALTDALAEDPEVGGDRLWRRAQELLGDLGEQLSRRTAYRILAQLRAERDDEDDAPDSLRGAVRTALPLLPEDPPLALGGSLLAQRLLPDETDPLLRGTLLQQALRDVLEQLRPAGPVSTNDRNWWPYLICMGEFESSQRRAELQQELALSASTYSRAKRQGLDRITTLLPQVITQMIEAPTSLASQRLPRTTDFVGRHDAQKYYDWRLNAEGLAHIWGLPGSGKTALAAELAADGHRNGQTILWHICRAGPDSTLVGIVRGLAQGLAGAGDETLWRELRQVSAESVPTPEMFDLLCEGLSECSALIVLDDIHRLDSEALAMLLDAFADLVERRQTQLLLVGRNQIPAIECSPLLGMNEQEARLLWTGAPALSADQWSALYTQTGGLPQPLRRAAAAYRRAGDLARPDDWIDEVTEWVQEQIWSRLEDDEQRLLAAIHTLDARPWADQAEHVCESLGMAPEALDRLRRRALAAVAGASIGYFAALRPCISARLREDSDLRERLEALIAKLEEASATTLATTDADEADTPDEPASVEQAELSAQDVPDGPELLARLRDALTSSANYLQGQPDDDVAQQLASELELLQAALPDPSAPRMLQSRPQVAAPAP